MKYVTAHKWEHGWELRIDGDPVTQVKTLDKADRQIRDYLATVGADDTQEIVVTPCLDGLEDECREVREDTAEVARRQRAAAKRSRQVAQKLRARGVSVTDSATILGVSRGRVSQLVKGSMSLRNAGTRRTSSSNSVTS